VKKSVLFRERLIRKWKFSNLCVYIILILIIVLLLPTIYDGSKRETAEKILDQITYENENKILKLTQKDFKNNINIKKINDLQTIHDNPQYASTIYELTGHQADVNSVAFSPDGKLLASGSGDYTIKIWNLKDGNEIHHLTEHTRNITSVAFSPNGEILASASWDTTIKLWDPISGLLLASLEGHTQQVQSISFSPDGKHLASGSHDKTIKIWNMESKSLLTTINTEHAGAVLSVKYSPDGNYLASGSADKTIKIWSATDYSSELRNLIGHTGQINAIDFTPNNTILASGSNDRTIKFWDVTTGTERNISADHLLFVRSVNFSPDGTRLVTGGAEGSIKIWDMINTSNILNPQTINAHLIEAASVAYSPDGTMIASGSYDQTIKIWNVPEVEKILTLNTDINGKALAFSPDSSLLASGDSSIIRLWNVTEKIPISVLNLTGHQGIVLTIAFSSDGKYLASGEGGTGSDFIIRLWDVSSGEKLRNFTGHTARVRSVAFSPNDDLLASGSRDNTIKLWNVSSGALLKNIPVETSDGLYSVTFSPDGIQLASGGDFSMNLWNIPSGIEERSYLTNFTDIYSVIFSPDGSMLISGSSSPDPSVKFWDLNKRTQLLPSLNGHSRSTNSVVISFDGKIVASGSNDDTVKFWDVKNKKILRTLTHHIGDVISVAFSQNGKIFASGSEFSTVKVIYDIDVDLDGIPDWWESQFGLYQSNYWDKFVDTDNDGLINSLEYYLNINPLIIDSDEDLMTDGWEYLHGFNPNLDDASMDKDNDGISNVYEFLHNMDPTNSADALEDFDNDGLSNLVEFELGLNASNPLDSFEDTDNDGMPNLWEIIYKLNPLDASDAAADNDLDGMPNLWEFDMALNPKFNDSFLDKDNDEMWNIWEYHMGLNARDSSDALKDSDNDGLTNVEEFHFNSSAILSDTDNDGMSDLFEFNMNLDPQFNEAELDADGDRISNLNEFIYGFNATNPNDALSDADGDWVSNIEEINRGTNPRDLWSVPILSLSVLHLGLGIILTSGTLGLFSYIYNRKRRKQSLITQLEAPDYTTALKIKTSGYSDYSKFVLAESEAKTMMEIGTGSYLNDQSLKAIQKFEEALEIFERLDNTILIAESVFKVALIQKEMNTLTAQSSILRRFPSPIILNPIVNAFDLMIQALIAERNENWGSADNSWQSALNIEELDIEFKMICQGALLTSEFRSWSAKSMSTPPEVFLKSLTRWQKICEKNQLYDSLCKAYLLQARVALATGQFNDVDDWFDKCLIIANEENLKRYKEIAEKEIEIFQQYKSKITSLVESKIPIPRVEQEKRFQEYIKAALYSMKIEEEK
jgi:WD40 repeat protein